MGPPPKGWYRRGDRHPPHFDAGDIAQFVTFRLADSLPQKELRAWKHERETKQIDEGAYHQRIESYLDAGYGRCWLRDSRVSEVVQSALLHFDGQRYELHAWTVMPNHVHVLITPHDGTSLVVILHSWKSFTSKIINRMIDRSGTLWQDDYFDRYIRDEKHFQQTLQYIAENPVQAGLCARAEDWPWSFVC